ncbi:MAG: hypothetical protein PSV36_16500 [Algoriphagus sp.]|nr:hypothetical protein [Algoriphagus sp.]
MAYKLLYIEDEDSSSIVANLEKNGNFIVETWSPDSFEELGDKIKGKDLLIMDFRLTHSKTIVDGPAFAQALRTKNSTIHMNIPMFLFSVENNITDYYKDYTSQDLFDFSVPKGEYLLHSDKYNDRMISILDGYKCIIKSKNDLKLILDISEDFKNDNLDYRIEFSLSKKLFSEDVYAFSSFIHHNLIRSIGVLIGPDMLSARLGVSQESDDWPELLSQLENKKYTGIFSKVYDRWWTDSISDWFKSQDEQNRSLRRLTAEDRVTSIMKITGLQKLMPLKKIQKSNYSAISSKFWTICKETKMPIDYIDGYELYDRDLFVWQEPEYISFLGKSSKRYSKYIKPNDQQKIVALETKLKKDVGNK